MITAMFAASGPAFASVPSPVQVNFSGGSGSPLTITLPQAITYTVTNDTPSSGLVFVFQDVYPPVPIAGITGGLISGSISRSINGGAAATMSRIGSFDSSGVIDDNDLFFHSLNNTGANLNDVVVLASGSLTTGFPVSGAAPPSGLYSAILTDGNWVQIDPVPEPSGLLAALALPAAATLSRRRRRRSCDRAPTPARARHGNAWAQA